MLEILPSSIKSKSPLILIDIFSTRRQAASREFICFPRCTAVKNPSENAGDTRDESLIPGWGRSPGGGNDNPLQYSCLENSIDREDWQATVRGIAKSQT